MKLRRRGSTGDVIDNRGRRMGAMGGAIGGGGLIAVIIVVLLSGVFGGSSGGFDLGQALNQLPLSTVAVPAGPSTPDPDADLTVFVEDALADIQDTWTATFASGGQQYDRAKLVLFTGGTGSGCGNASSAVGPFYCPADSQLYLDFDFFRDLDSRFGAPGDFAQAYVIAHEVGHHIQNLKGIDDEVRRLSREDPDNANELSVRQELQADCFAGVWGNSAAKRGVLEAGDVEEGLEAAAAVGDDRLQRQAGVAVDRDTWTHGSSEQRVEWFRRGFDTGNPSRCDTFSGDI